MTSGTSKEDLDIITVGDLHNRVEVLEKEVKSLKSAIQGSPYPIWPTVYGSPPTSYPTPWNLNVPGSTPPFSVNYHAGITPPRSNELTTPQPKNTTMAKTPVAQKDPVIPAHHKPPLPILQSENALPSSVIEEWPNKKGIDEVIEANHKLAKVSKASTLAVKIAVDAVFGSGLMKKCTALGGRDLPGLPRVELFKNKAGYLQPLPILLEEQHRI